MKEKKIGTALLSYGMSGEVFHGPLLAAHPGFEVKGVYHRTRDKEIRHSFPVRHSVHELLQDESIELVIVNTPNNTHFRYAADALSAGKHVIVEKPFTVTIAEADELIALAQKTGRILSVFQNRRWDGGFLTVQKIVNENLLGRIVEFELHYDRYRNYIEQNTWKEIEAPGTGILYNLGSHMIDQVLVLFGKPQYADARMGTQRTGGLIIDYYDIRFTYEKLNVIVKSSYLVREPGPMYRINGTDGSFVKFGIDPQEQDLKEKKMPGTEGWGLEPKSYWGKLNTTINGKHFEGPYETVPGDYLLYYQNIFEVIREGKELIVRPEQAREVISIIEACIKSNASKSAVKL
jgi:scyllo-inositol 2-dehydrogenase (NADP+)